MLIPFLNDSWYCISLFTYRQVIALIFVAKKIRVKANYLLIVTQKSYTCHK